MHLADVGDGVAHAGRVVDLLVAVAGAGAPQHRLRVRAALAAQHAERLLGARSPAHVAQLGGDVEHLAVGGLGLRPVADELEHLPELQQHLEPIVLGRATAGRARSS